MEKLGINPFLILTQIFNFFLLLFILKKILYKPILAMLDKRRTDVEQTLQLKQELEKQKEQADKGKEAAVQEGQREAARIVEAAQQKGEKVIQQLETKAHESADEIVRLGREHLVASEQEIRQKLADQVSQTAIQAAEAVLLDQLTEAQKQKVLKDAVQRFTSHA